MFIELMPLFAGRTVLIIVARADDHTLRVNVIPHAKADENPALSTPLTYAGSPEELDAELGTNLAGYVQTHLQTTSTLAEAKATLEAAAKAVQEEAKRKAEERRKVAQKPPDKGSPSATAQPMSAVPPAAESATSPPPMVSLGLIPTSAPWNRTCANQTAKRGENSESAMSSHARDSQSQPKADLTSQVLARRHGDFPNGGVRDWTPRSGSRTPLAFLDNL